MTDTSFEELVMEGQFVGLLQTQAQVFFKLSNTLLRLEDRDWSKKHFFQLINEADALETFLDDYGARFNESFAYLTEAVASVRGLAAAGYSMNHLWGRFDSYGAEKWFPGSEHAKAIESLTNGRLFVRTTVTQLLKSIREESSGLGLEITPETFPEENFQPIAARRRLPRNVGQSAPVAEEQKIAEVSTKYLQACEMMREVSIRRLEDVEDRRRFFKRCCTEEQARVYEATVHNLQSTYDTHIQNTVIESRDERLSELRGHVSAGLHLLQTVTQLVHFIERHEDEIRSEDAKHRIGTIVSAQDVQNIALNDLLLWADRILQSGAPVAENLLPEYTNLQELEVTLPDDVMLHARPVSLIVSIVNHHGTPVQMQVGGQSSNAASILELLVLVGSHPDARRYVFRGDENPLRDIRLLFEHGLGEHGLQDLPDALDYLHGGGSGG